MNEDPAEKPVPIHDEDPLEPQPLYLLNPVSTDDDVSEAEVEFRHTWLPTHRLERDQLLYHYTDLKGLRGILDTRALWFSHASMLNDPAEMRHGQRIVSMVVEAMRRKASQLVSDFLVSLLGQVTGAAEGIYNAFVVCFCESGTLLSAWRAYGDHGRGYSLGFRIRNRTRLVQTDSDEPRMIFLRKVIYSEEEQLSLVSEYLDLVSSAVGRTASRKRGLSGRDKAMMCMQAANQLIDMIYCFKHPAFSEEREWRMIRSILTDHDPAGLRFREVQSQLKAYRSADLFDYEEDDKVFPLGEIRFGPALDPVSTGASIDLYIRHAATNGSAIRLPRATVQGAGFRLRQ